MKLVNVLLGQCGRLLRISPPGGGAIYGLNLAKAFEERYGFLQGPRTLPEFDASKGITFLHGYFEQRVVIDRIQIYDNGILADAKLDTDEVDAFLDDVVQWIQERAKLQVIATPDSAKIYTSQLEVQTDKKISALVPTLVPIGRAIADILRGYGHITPDWEPAGLSFGSSGAGDAASFKFERREGANARDVYFASARMRTKDHLHVLEEIDALL
ncbi:MAG: hypothetical protein WEC82_04330 [Xanthobacteraceae bacterium]